jgi:hypothetical protein
MDEEMISYLLENGYIQVSRVDEEGNVFYKLTDLGLDFYPNFLEENTKLVSEGIFNLWMQNAIEIYFDHDGTPLVEITQASYALAKSDSLTDDEDHDMLVELIRLWELRRKEE